jgi:regulator of protease activity HflC (stomatin/prohibitin superfamily)
MEALPASILGAMEAGLILIVRVTLFGLLLAANIARILPRGSAGVVECFGRYRQRAAALGRPRQACKGMAIEPPGSFQGPLQKQMRDERDRRSSMLTAGGSKQSHILNAEGAEHAALLAADGERQAPSYAQTVRRR